MYVSVWIAKADDLIATCDYEIGIKNGNKPITNKEAKTLNELQNAIGSHHGIREVKYK